MERRHQEVAGTTDAIASKGAAGPVRAVRCRPEPHQQQPRARIAESWYGFAPVDLVTVRAPPGPRDLLAVVSQPRAASAGDDVRVNRYQTRHAFFRTIGASALHE